MESKYVEEEGLAEIIDFSGSLPVLQSPFDAVSGGFSTPIPPDVDDLVRIHKLIRRRHAFTVLEFGVGYSTLAIAHALQKNEEEWKALPKAPAIRNRFPFQLFTVDASQKWLATAEGRVPDSLRPRIHFHHSTVHIGTFQGRLCHYYDRLPDIIPDFIYLDGPSPKDVQGEMNGMTFGCDERTVMSGDVLLMESTMLPGTMILIDGRTNNARFLERNFQRNWRMEHDSTADITTFELIEERLGRYNILGADPFTKPDF